MECHELMQLLSEYLDSEMDAESRKAVEAHVQSCPRCRAHFRTLRTTITLVQTLERRGAGREMVVRLQRRIVRIERE